MGFGLSKRGTNSDNKDDLRLLRLTGFASWKALFLTDVTESP